MNLTPRLASCSTVFALLIAAATGCAPADPMNMRPDEDPCAAATACGGCMALPGCGWCAGSGRCISGNATTAVGGACTSGWSTDRGVCGSVTPPACDAGATCQAMTINGPNGARLEIPAGAASTPAEFAITVRNPVTPALPSEINARGPAYAFTPDGYMFAAPAAIRVPFTGNTAAGLTLYTVTPAGAWAPVAGAQVVDGTMRAQVSRLGVFVVGLPSRNTSAVAWNDVTGALPTNQPVRDFAFVGGRVLAASGRGVYRSEDNGATWLNASAGLPSGVTTYRFAQLGAQLFVATERGVFRSNDAGGSWTDVSRGLPMRGSNQAPVQALAAHRGQLFAGGEGFVMASTDAGATWVARQRDLPLRFAPYVLYSRDNVLFAGTYGAGAWSSADDGASWRHSDFGDESVYDLTRLGDNLFGATAIGVQRYTAGERCEVLDQSVPERSPVVLSVAAAGTRLYAALGGVGVHYSVDNGMSWIEARDGLPRDNAGEYEEVRLVRTDGTNVFAAAGSGSSFRVFRAAAR